MLPRIVQLSGRNNMIVSALLNQLLCRKVTQKAPRASGCKHRLAMEIIDALYAGALLGAP